MLWELTNAAPHTSLFWSASSFSLYFAYNCYCQIMKLIRSIWFGSIRRIEGLEAVSNLRVLDLSSNSISIVEGCSSEPSNSPLLRFSTGLENLHRLERLLLPYNCISDISGLQHLPSKQIDTVDLTDNRVERLSQLNCLRHLSVRFLLSIFEILTCPGDAIDFLIMCFQSLRELRFQGDTNQHSNPICGMNNYLDSVRAVRCDDNPCSPSSLSNRLFLS
jgi:hypothetical protein